MDALSIIYLYVCVAGLPEFKIEDICQTYTLQLRYEMTDDEIERKIRYICDGSRDAAIAHGGGLTKCELVDEIPEINNSVEIF